jgi:single-stranded DNA-specific DHH superfamily exonuclease
MKDKFFLFLEEVSQKIQELVDQEKRFLLVSTKDADGIAATILLLHYFYLNNAEAHAVYLENINKETIKDLYATFPEDAFIFVDSGSGFTGWIKAFANRETFIIDHLFLEEKERVIKGTIYQVNPRIFGIDSSREISSSGIAYFLLKKLGHEFREISYLSLAGSIGDLQELEGFIGINEQILNELIEDGLVEVKKGLKLFGLASKPLYKAIQLSLETYIPGISGSEERAIEFLSKLKIPLKKGGCFTTYLDLTEDEQRKLVSEIIKLRLKENVPNAEKIVGDLYLISNGFYFREIHEVTALLNAAAKLNKISTAIAFLLGDKRFFDEAQDITVEYKSILTQILKCIVEHEIEISNLNGISLLDLSSVCSEPSLVSPISNFLSTSSLIPSKLIVVCCSREDNVYASVRTAPFRNIFKVVKLASEKVGASLSGYDPLGGVVVEKEKLEEFIKSLKIYARQESVLI